MTSHDSQSIINRTISGDLTSMTIFVCFANIIYEPRPPSGLKFNRNAQERNN